MATISRLSVSLTANTTKLTKGLKTVRGKLKSFSKDVFSLKGAIAGALGVTATGGLLGQIIDTNREMQTLKSSLKTVTGSAENAEDAFASIKRFAVTTPFDLQEWTEGFIKMKSLGLDPSEEALTSYGNTAAAMGKSLNQMVEAVADAATGEFERLKEFGIKAKKQGEDVTFTFQGVKTTVKNEAAEIEKFLQSIGNNQFADAMTDQMENLGPAFSNLGQAVTDLSVKIGEAGLNDLVLSLAKNITNFVNSFDDTKLLTIKNFFSGIADAISWVAEAWNAISFLQGNDMLEQWLNSNPSQIGDGGGLSVPGGFQPGQFNDSGGDIDRLIKQIQLQQANPEAADETRKAREDNNKWQAKILEAIQQQSNVAVAG